MDSKRKYKYEVIGTECSNDGKKDNDIEMQVKNIIDNIF